jgi:hypothetical protein
MLCEFPGPLSLVVDDSIMPTILAAKGVSRRVSGGGNESNSRNDLGLGVFDDLASQSGFEILDGSFERVHENLL